MHRAKDVVFRSVPHWGERVCTFCKKIRFRSISFNWAQWILNLSSFSSASFQLLLSLSLLFFSSCSPGSRYCSFIPTSAVVSFFVNVSLILSFPLVCVVRIENKRKRNQCTSKKWTWPRIEKFWLRRTTTERCELRRTQAWRRCWIFWALRGAHLPIHLFVWFNCVKLKSVYYRLNE